MRNTFLLSFSFLCASVLSVTGCSTMTPHSSDSPQMANLLLAEPAPVSVRSQMAIARYNQILAEAPLKDNERAELFYQRGMLYDSVGLSGLARADFTQAIQLKPDLAEAYNSIGIHYIQQMDFIQAYEAFDSTLDINPEYDFALLNRGIALYYGGRADLAIKDLQDFYAKDEADPYRALWAFIAEQAVAPESASAHLRVARDKLDAKNWAVLIVDFYLGRIGENDLLNALVIGVTSQNQLTDRLCEAYFYLGKFHNALEHRGIASNYFKLALSTNVYEYVEHRYARLELNLLREQAFRDVQAQ